MATYYLAGIPYSNELYHYGIKGQKWGLRRFQNSDGTLTEAGKKRYGSDSEKKKLSDLLTTKAGNTYNSRSINQAKLKATPQVKHAIAESSKEISSATKRLNDLDKKYREKEFEFYADKKLVEEYRAKSVENVMKDSSVKGMSKKDLLEFYKDYDGDLGYRNSFETFKNSKDPRAKEITKIQRDMNKAQKQLLDASDKYADMFLGTYGDQKGA